MKRRSLLGLLAVACGLPKAASASGKGDDLRKLRVEAAKFRAQEELRKITYPDKDGRIVTAYVPASACKVNSHGIEFCELP